MLSDYFSHLYSLQFNEARYTWDDSDVILSKI